MAAPCALGACGNLLQADAAALLTPDLLSSSAAGRAATRCRAGPRTRAVTSPASYRVADVHLLLATMQYPFEWDDDTDFQILSTRWPSSAANQSLEQFGNALPPSVMPSALGMMIGRPPRRTAAAEFDVPRSIPIIGMVSPR